MFYSAVHRWYLLDGTPERVKDRFQLLLINAGRVSLPGNLPAAIIGVGGHTQFNLGTIYLGGICQKLNDACSPAEANGENSGSRRVKGTGMPHTPLPAKASHHGNNAKRGLVLRLINIQYTVQGYSFRS